MSTPPTLPQGSNNLSTDDLTKLLEFLTKESERSRDMVARQIGENRNTLQQQAQYDRNALTLIVGVLAVVFTAFGFIGYKSVGDFRDDLKQSAEATEKAAIQKNDAAIEAEKAKSQEQLDQIRRELKEASEREIQSANGRLNDVLSSENVQASLHKSLEEATSGEAGKLIDQRIDKRIDPLVSQAQTTVNQLRFTALITRMDADDASASNELVAAEPGTSAENKDIIERAIQDRLRVASGVVDQIEGEGPPCVHEPDFEQKLNSSDVRTRFGALGRCSNAVESYRWEESIPVMDQETIANAAADKFANDTSLTVQYESARILKQLFYPSPGLTWRDEPILSRQEFLNWWQTHKKDVTILLLVSRANFRLEWAPNYDQLKIERSKTSPEYASAVDAALEKMRNLARQELARQREEASQTTQSRTERLTPAWQSCNDAAAALGEELAKPISQIGTAMDTKQGKIYSLPLELNAAASCQLQQDLLEKIGKYAAETNNLPGRYYAAQALNGSANANLDPFDSKAIREWSSEHRSGAAK